MTESLIALLGQQLHFQNGFKGAELPAHFLMASSWVRGLAGSWIPGVLLLLASWLKSSVEGCTGPEGCDPEPPLFRKLLGVFLQAWGDGEAAVCSNTSRLADEAVIRQCVCVSVSFCLLLFSLITISEVISDASLTVLSKQGEFSKLFAMSTKGNWLSSSPSSSKEAADLQ